MRMVSKPLSNRMEYLCMIEHARIELNSRKSNRAAFGYVPVSKATCASVGAGGSHRTLNSLAPQSATLSAVEAGRGPGDCT